jgi:uncharacterized protein YukE
MDGLEKRVDNREERIGGRFSELRAHVDAVAESWDSKFALLYDFFKARADGHDAALAELKRLIATNHAELRAAVTSIQSRLSALERRGR